MTLKRRLTNYTAGEYFGSEFLCHSEPNLTKKVNYVYAIQKEAVQILFELISGNKLLKCENDTAKRIKTTL